MQEKPENRFSGWLACVILLDARSHKDRPGLDCTYRIFWLFVHKGCDWLTLDGVSSWLLVSLGTSEVLVFPLKFWIVNRPPHTQRTSQSKGLPTHPRVDLGRYEQTVKTQT